MEMVFVLWILPIILSGLVWKAKGGQSGIGGLFGLFLSWLGVLVALLLTPKKPPEPERVECPHCLEKVLVGATVCPHCQRDIPSAGRFRSMTG